MGLADPYQKFCTMSPEGFRSRTFSLQTRSLIFYALNYGNSFPWSLTQSHKYHHQKSTSSSSIFTKLYFDSGRPRPLSSL